ncbi:Thiosulfate sulfurtransferase 16, chloroplastic [Stylosanthes scabra]|uniref:Thiosulfate sulfurtransferase 16, chloroplastic n=1 Tax=Stylosanthes scabra TaxID=79078 RepID=A0ABU6TH18_9FABA|nr:Thiosulfate sulfurtransferase 16, chloroplastic [Stylosanthes scabra]
MAMSKMKALRRTVSLFGVSTTTRFHGTPSLTPFLSQPQINTKTCPNDNLKSIEVLTSVPVDVAHSLLQAGYRYLDVRTIEEFRAGHTPGAINIPYFHIFGEDKTKNAEFIEQVSSQFSKNDKILVGCKRGIRSKSAATDLLDAGFSGVKDVAGGYDDWTKNGLPTKI